MSDKNLKQCDNPNCKKYSNGKGVAGWFGIYSDGNTVHAFPLRPDEVSTTPEACGLGCAIKMIQAELWTLSEAAQKKETVE